jgi:hypothetical protein
MQENHFIKSFVRLGREMKNLKNPLLADAMRLARKDNPFFTIEMQRAAIINIVDKFLQPRPLEWLLNHAGGDGKISERGEGDLWEKTVGIIMAGNLPLVGFHDFLCTLACGRNAYIKLSSKDSRLLPAVYKMLCNIDSYWSGKVVFCKFASNTCAIIASGSDDSMAEIKKEYPGVPKLLRGSRFSFAVVNGKESEEQLCNLTEDMLLYFGLGCRSVSYLFVPEHYDFKNLINAAQKLKLTGTRSIKQIMMSVGAYKNSYLRMRALNIMSSTNVCAPNSSCADENGFIDGGFFILQRGNSVHPPLAQINFAYYKYKKEVAEFEKTNKSKIQKKYTTFGLAQRPEIDDFADRADTVRFILKN